MLVDQDVKGEAELMKPAQAVDEGLANQEPVVRFGLRDMSEPTKLLVGGGGVGSELRFDVLGLKIDPSND
jgi:hypothetical protein